LRHGQHTQQHTQTALGNSERSTSSTVDPISLEPLDWGNLDPQAIRTLNHLATELGRERRKIQELVSSLGFALRAFNNLNQILELIPLVACRLTDAEGAALVLFQTDGSLQLERMYCTDGWECSRVRQVLESTTQGLSATVLSDSAATATDLVSLSFLETQLDEQLGRALGPQGQFFATPLLLKHHVRGRLYVFSHQPTYEWDEQRQTLIRLVADHAAIAIENDELAADLRRKARLAKEVEIGSDIQARLQPACCPDIAGVSLAARCQPASQVGGDYYDFIPVPTPTSPATVGSSATQLEDNLPADDRSPQLWSIAIGDVMGKGVPAGLLMMATRGVLRAEVLNHHSPAQILQHLNHVMYGDMDNSNRFVSLFYSEYRPQTRQLCFSNAAHPPALWWQAARQEVVPLNAQGMLIGLDLASTYEEKCVQLQSGDVVVYYTDGFTEAANGNGDRLEESGLIEAIATAVRQSQNPQDILESLFERVRQFRNGEDDARFADDMTLVVLKVNELPAPIRSMSPH
jgi:sigma-B regulation protein RsbU (phosphoserine phosphatase)